MKSLTGNSLRAAALVLHSLSDEQAERLQARLAPADRFKLESALAQMAAVTSMELLDALERLAREAERDLIGEASRDPLREIARPLQTGKWEEHSGDAAPAAKSHDEARAVGGNLASISPLGFLRHLEPGLLGRLIVDEHPEDIALVVVDLPAELAAELLQQFDPILRFSVLRRMCRLENPNQHRAEELAFQLKLRLQQQLGSRNSADETAQPRNPLRKGLAAAARAVSLVEPQERRELLQQLRVVDGELGTEVAQQVFEFERLGDLSDEQIRLLLKRANTAWWAPALLSAPPEVRERILSCFAKPAAAIVKREMKALGEVSPQLAQRAQQEIVATWIRLTG